MNKPKILIIDDEQELLDILRMSLSLEGFDIITASNGEEGIAKYQQEDPDLIICDIVMPQKDGYEVLSEIKKQEKRWIPFIMLSAVGDFKKIKQAYEGDIDFYLTKPVEPAILVKNIKTLLNLAKNQPT